MLRLRMFEDNLKIVATVLWRIIFSTLLGMFLSEILKSVFEWSTRT